MSTTDTTVHPDNHAAPLVSVIVRSIGRKYLLRDALDSVAAQTYPNIEVVVVNAKGEGHCDIDEWCGHFPMRMIGTNERLQRSRAANIGLDAARGEYLIFLDDDDWFETKHIEKLVTALNQNPRFKVAYTETKCVDERKNLLSVKFDMPFDATQLLAGNYIPIHAVMFSRALLALDCRMDESLDVYEDWDFWIQLSRHTDFLLVSGMSAVYRITQQSGFGVVANPVEAEPAALVVYKKWHSKLNDKNIVGLMQAVRLNREKNGQIASLNQAVADRDGQIASLNQAVADRDGQIASLNQAVADRDGQIAALYNSTSWRVTQPLRIVVYQIKQLRRAAKLVVPAIRRGGGLKSTFKKAFKLYRHEGLAGIRRGFRIVATSEKIRPSSGSGEFDRNNYAEWIRQYDTLTDDIRAAMRARIEAFVHKPLISVVMPTYNPKPEWLSEAIESVRKQIYPHWELCIADDASTDKAIRHVLEYYARMDTRIKVVFRKQNGHISAASNSALELATGPWVALLDHDDLLTEHALFWVADAINQNPDVRLIYSDEDKIDEGGRRMFPYFKCDWNVDLFYSHNMFCHLGVYHAGLLRQIGGFRTGLEGAQDYDLALRCIEQIGSKQITHIPRVLYHWRMHTESTARSLDAKPYAMLAGERVIDEHFQRCNVAAKAELIGYGYRIHYALPEILPLVSLIIPTRNGLHLIRQCISSVLEKTTYQNYEILIIDNGSDDPETLDYFKELSPETRVRVVRDNRPFNFSALNNAAVKFARGDLVLLLNNDIEVITPNWLSEMVSHALRPGIGAVGARLWYPNDTLQHGGVILGLGGVANHSHYKIKRGDLGYFCRAGLAQNYSAVTGACLLIRKAIYEEVGGLNEKDLQIAFNDIDFCLRVREAGYRNVWTPFAELYHHESASRGYEDTPKKNARLAKEAAYFMKQWDDLLLNDPCYSPNLTLENEDFSLAWPPRTVSYANFLVPYDSQYQADEKFSGLSTDIKAIAFYLPQFHECKQNNEWWGNGFTEWTNTRQAAPRFSGHYQPREPHDDIGYYDLSDIESIRKQATLARKHGIYGFCFYHYWFSGERVLEKPVDLLLQNPDIDINFCLCWVNENWTRTWDGLSTNILLEQKYLPEDPINFIRDISGYLADPRYIRIDNKPVIMVYKPHMIPNAKAVFKEWREWWLENTGGELLIWCNRTDFEDTGAKNLENIIDAVVEFPPAVVPYVINKESLNLNTSGHFHNYPRLVSDIIQGTEITETPSIKFYRSVMLGWDNSARRKQGWSIWYGFSLRTYYSWLRHTIAYTRKSFPADQRFVFINAWNEWAEGTYIEPDKKYGYASINTTSRALFDLPLQSFPPGLSGDGIQSKQLDIDDNSIRHEKSNSLAIVIHAFYVDVFENIIDYLSEITSISLSLYITCPRNLEYELFKILAKQRHPFRLLPVENRGRDVLPFLKIMPEVIRGNHEFFIKIHTKKTTHRMDGDRWRMDLFDQLISEKAIQDSIDYLKNNPDVGILGPTGHLIPIKKYFGSNQARVEELVKRLGMDVDTLMSLNFVAGTMFAGRAIAIVPALNLELQDNDFEEESGQIDGTLAHVIERAFSASAWASGLAVATIPNSVNNNYEFAEQTLLA